MGGRSKLILVNVISWSGLTAYGSTIFLDAFIYIFGINGISWKEILLKKEVNLLPGTVSSRHFSYFLGIFLK